MKFLHLLISSLLLFSCSESEEQTENETIVPAKTYNYNTELIISALDNPWGMVVLPDSSFLINEKMGSIVHFKNGVKTKISNVPVSTELGQGGLLDIELHPDYKNNGWIYLSYASAEGGNGAHTAISRAKLDGTTLVDNELLYKATPNSTSGAHFGSRIEFDNDGYLYFSIGDRYNRDVNPQDLTKDGGKVYRLKDDGSIPDDNPFVNENGAKKAIYSYGHRNPQGMDLHPETGMIWTHEHGPQGGDEVNKVEKGKNYGWPIITYGVNYGGSPITSDTAKDGLEQPIHYWVPSIAPCGMSFVSSDYYPDWKGDLLVGSLKFGNIERLVLEGDKVVGIEKLFDGIGRVRNVQQLADGFIYIAVEDDGIYKVVRKEKEE